MQILATAWKPELLKDRLIWMKSSLGMARFSKFTLSCSSSTDRLTLHCSEVLAATTMEGGSARKGTVRMFFQTQTRCLCIFGGQGGTGGREEGKAKSEKLTGSHWSIVICLKSVMKRSAVVTVHAPKLLCSALCLIEVLQVQEKYSVKVLEYT